MDWPIPRDDMARQGFLRCSGVSQSIPSWRPLALSPGRSELGSSQPRVNPIVGLEFPKGFVCESRRRFCSSL